MATGVKIRPPVLCLELAGTLMTPTEFDAVEEYDENYHYELIHGVLVVVPIPLAGETGPNELLGHWLALYQETHPQGRCLDATLPQQYVRTRTSHRLADRVLWIGLGRVPDPATDLPTIAVEFVSESRRDRERDYVDKRREYLEAGVAEYWIIDRFRRTLTVVRNHPEGPQEVLHTAEQSYHPPLLPGFELPLGRLFAVADGWAKPAKRGRRKRGKNP